MRKMLLKYCENGMPVEIIYADRTGKLSQRKIQIIAVDDTNIKAHCFTKKALRSFAIQHILALFPVKGKRKESLKAS